MKVWRNFSKSGFGNATDSFRTGRIVQCHGIGIFQIFLATDIFRLNTFYSRYDANREWSVFQIKIPQPYVFGVFYKEKNEIKYKNEIRSLYISQNQLRIKLMLIIWIAYNDFKKKERTS
jgi:hypothetical protein